MALSLNFQHIETDSFRQGSAFAHSHHVSHLDADKGRRAVSRHILMALFVAVVLANKVEVLPADDNGAFHLNANHGAGKNAATNGHVAGKGTLFVNISSGDGVLRSLESQANVLVPTSTSPLGNNPLIVQKDCVLFGKGAKILHVN